MVDQSLRSFLADMEAKGELVRFTKPVDPVRNMAAVEWRTYDELGKASLFTSIERHPGWTACSQIVADRRKWAIALGIEEDRLVGEIGRRLKQAVPTVSVGRERAPVKEVVRVGAEVDLGEIPAMVVSEKDGGRFLASGMAITRDPETGIRNVSVHRQQIMGRDKTGFVMVPRHARRIYDLYSERGEPMPVAMVFGAHPSLFFGAAFTTSFGIDELTLAGSLLGEGVRMVRCETLDIEVPAEAEMVIEGEVLPGHHMEPEGPFGEVPGTYAEAGMAHVFRVKAITRRADPIYYAIHCGFPVTDTQGVTSLGIEVATTEHLRHVEGGLDLLDVRCLTVSGLMMLVVKMRPRVEGQAKTALLAALSGPYLHPKVAVAVDDDIDAGDPRQILWSITTRVHAERDVVLIPHTRVFALDNISPMIPGLNTFQRVGTKWLIDATKPAVSLPEERARFEKAMPLNYAAVNLRDFLPDAV
ncbi:UbiD family decarboxylase [Azospirillum sp. ST 5-10]|uniref:UbiD family decarboxylase n=1 Tax=unclassified Azospirillum TaxID=2630922 RepID=UPI003F4A41D7